ncbi:MAG: AAA family ATPase [Bacteroidetes bacterium]|nr:AAA family ATPase [Bacteroidota bacterium]
MKNSHIDDTNHYFKLAFDYVMNTSCPIYLTGKAGTGKTTFLKYVKQHCTKNMIVVAPTGVAAINAGGVTMHSFFQLPFGPYVADAPRGFGLNENMVDKNALLGKLKLGGNKRTLIQELELLVIDEVSMLRSDMLDAIDTILRMVRKRNKPFGGVQVLFIGDLYQLPPVVKDTEATIFKTYYQSPFFFHAKVFEQTQPIFIELKKIYRQNEQQFIDILNNLRNNDLSEQDFDILNSRYNPTFTPKDHKYITLTSHNHKADAINHQELEKLKSTVYEYHGEIKGEFNDKQLPTDLLLKLKEGAQVMFIKNDSSGLGRYYNGKIAIIDKIDKNEIIVRFPDSNDIMTIEKETWENITYRHDDEKNNIEEKVLGTYTQFPLRLAWAITIHKSQGLTFTHAIIDAGSSFAPGQVYVALSRCTSLEGIVLQSRILPNAIHSNYRI